MTPTPPDAATLHRAITRVLDYRQHVTGCEINQTEFCSCGLREAMEALDSAWKASRQPPAADAAPLRTLREKAEQWRRIAAEFEHWQSRSYIYRMCADELDALLPKETP